jgi:hypothetical protein
VCPSRILALGVGAALFGFVIEIAGAALLIS